MSYCHHHHHHHPANMVLGHLLTLSSVTRPKVSFMVPWFLLPVGLQSFSILGNVTGHSVYMLQPISSVFLDFVQNWGYIHFVCNLGLF